MLFPDRPDIRRMLVHMTDMDQEDLPDGQVRNLFGSRPGDKPVVLPGFRVYAVHKLGQAACAGPEQGQGRLDGPLIGGPALRPFVLRERKIPLEGKLDPICPQDGPQVDLP